MNVLVDRYYERESRTMDKYKINCQYTQMGNPSQLVREAGSLLSI